MIELVEQQPGSDKRPICPHCSKEINKINAEEIRSVLGRRYLYFCSDCLKVLGVSHRKGFWMG